MMAIVLRAQLISLFLFLIGCAFTSNWTIDRISTGDALYDSARMRYISKQAHPTLFFEFSRFQNQIQASIFLNRFRFESGSLTIDGICHEIVAQIHEGGMRVKLDDEITKKLIQALQDGRSIDILIDGFEEKLEPQGFSISFDQFMNKEPLFQNFLKGPTR